MIKIKTGAFAVSIALLNGCSWITDSTGQPVFRDRLNDYRVAEAAEPTKVPDHLDQRGLRGSEMPLPRGLGTEGMVYTDETFPPRPNPMTLEIKEEGLVLKEEAGQLWVESDMEVGRVVDALPRFIAEMRLQTVERSEADNIVVAGLDDAKDFEEVIEEDAEPSSNFLSGFDDHVYFRVRPGPEGQGSEIYVRHLSDAEGEIADVDWSAPSDNQNIDRVIYTELALYLSSLAPEESYTYSNTQTESLEVEITTSGNGVQVLSMKNIDYPRAWQSVGIALEKAGFKVEDYNRTEGLYYIRLPKNAEELKSTKTYFVDLFDDEEKLKTAVFRIRLTPADGAVIVGLEKDAATVADDVRTKLVFERLKSFF